jgi:uncharacterized protein
MIFYNHTEKRLRAGWRITLTTMLIISLLVVFSFLIPYQTGIMVIMAIILLVVLWFSSRAIDKRPYVEYGFELNTNWFVEFAAGNLMAALAMGGIVLTLAVSGHTTLAGSNISLIGLDGLSALFTALVLMTAVSIWEEAYFRSYLITNLQEGIYTQWIGSTGAVILAVLLSSILFGIAHTTNPHASWMAVINITIAGIVLAYPYIVTGSIAISVGMHLSWNYFQGMVFGLPVSGMQMEESILAAEVKGPEIITGADFGPEGGIIGFLGLILLAVLCRIYLILFYKK